MAFVQQDIQTRDFVAHRRDALPVGRLHDGTLAEMNSTSKLAFLRHQAVLEDVELLPPCSEMTCLASDCAASMANAWASPPEEIIRSENPFLMPMPAD